MLYNNNDDYYNYNYDNYYYYYAAYTFGLKHQWTYFLRTLPDIQDLLEHG